MAQPAAYQPYNNARLHRTPAVRRTQISVCFINKTDHSVTFWWHDGVTKEPKLYGVLLPKRYVNILTYPKHKWSFRDKFDGTYLIPVDCQFENSHPDVPYWTAPIEMPRRHTGDRINRFPVVISESICGLEYLALKTVSKILENRLEGISELPLPPKLRQKIEKYTKQRLEFTAKLDALIIPTPNA